MDSRKDLQNLVKSKIEFTTVDGNFEGVVRLVCPVAKKIIIEQLFFLPKRIFIGVLHFHIREILSFKIVSKSQSQLPILNRMHTKTNNELPSEIEIVSDALPNEERYSLKLPHWPNVILPTDSVILDCINELFHQSVAHIQQQKNIGVYLGGPSIGRDGLLSWLSITTSSCIFLFDIQTLKEKAFHEGGLRDVFQNPRIEKIFHDCRNASDSLYHKFGTKLVNVFDTQVGDLFVALQSNKKASTPQKVNSLNTCLAKYLDVPNTCQPKIKHRSRIENISHYSSRPLGNEMRDLLVKSVVYLRLLKKKLNRLMLNPYQRAVDVYLQVVQGASDQEILLESTSEDDVPLQLVMDGLQTVRFRNTMSDPLSANRARNNATENYANMFKTNSDKDTYNSSEFSKIPYSNEAKSYYTENFDKPCKGNKYEEIKNDVIDSDDTTNVSDFPQVNVVTRHSQHNTIITSRDKLSFSDECSGVDESLSNNDINATSNHKNLEKLGHSYTTNNRYSTMNLNGDFSNNVRKISIGRGKFMSSPVKCNKDLICQAKQACNGDKNAEVKFSDQYETNERKTKLRFLPAGMAYMS